MDAETGAFCGNGIIEGDEECDCGENESPCRDKCCQPGCMLNTTAQCGCVCVCVCVGEMWLEASLSLSAFQPCCDGEQCTFLPFTVQCQNVTECAQSQNCKYPPILLVLDPQCVDFMSSQLF